MNRTHRIVWSESHSAFIVTHEHAKAKGKPSSIRKALASAVVMALAAMAAAPALADSSCTGGVISITGPETSPCSLANGDALTVTNTGSIISGSSAAVYVTGGASAGSISNSGTITSTRSNGYGIYLNSGATGSITNNADSIISGGTSSGTGIHLRSGSSVTGGIINSGTISGFTGINISDSSVTEGITNLGGTISGSSNGIALSSNSTVGSILNSGTISASNGAAIYIRGLSSITGNIENIGVAALISGSTGIYVSNSSIGGSIINSGTISGTRSWGSGIYLSNSDITGDISNGATGTISGGTTSGAGISFRSGSSITGGITNSGTISGVIGISVRDGGSVTGGITNNATGTIFGGTGIDISGSGTVVASILNSGTISATYGGVYIHGGSSVAGNIDNNGAAALISGSSGIYVGSNGSIGGSIVNSGTITGTRSWGSGIYLSNSTIAGDIRNDANSEISGGTSSSGAGISMFNSSITGSIVNRGTISGVIGINVNGSTVAGGITNNADGTISGNSTGIKISGSSTVVASLLNSGTISGVTNAIYVDGSAALPNIDIIGTTAHLIGDVFAQNTALNITSGASFTSQGAFDVGSFDIANTGRFNMANDVTTATSFTNAGTLAVAEGVTATISGDYTQASTGIFQIGASSNSIYGKLVVSGTATLPADAMIDVNVNSVNTLANGQTLTGVIAAGTLSATTFAVTDNSTLFNFTGAVNGNAVDLTIAKATSVLDAFTTSGSGSGAGAATVLDQLIDAEADGDMGTVITALGTLSTDQEVADAVQQTLPLLSSGMSQVTTNALHGTNRIIQSRQDSNKGLSSGDEFLGDRQFWLKPVGSWTNQDDRKGVSGYDASTYGLVFGADGVVSDTTRVGAAFSYMHSNVDGNSTVAAQSASVKGYQAIAYGSFSLDERTDISVQGDIGNNKNKGRRTIDFGGLNRVARSDYDSWSAHIGAGLGRTFELNPKTSFVPSLRADYTWIADESYTESGAGALNLKVRRNTTDELILALDGKLAHACTEHATVTANLGLGYDVLAEKAAISAAFTGGGAQFVTKGLDPSPWMLRGGLGLAMTTSSAMEISARYDFEVRQDFDNQTASVKLRIPF